MKVVLIGSTGLLGRAIKDELENKNVDSLFLTHENFDVMNIADYKQILDFQPDIVINTAAYLGVEPCENNPLEAFQLNCKAVEDLANFCEAHGFGLAYISTDGVFDGQDGDYTEDSMPNPINMYGLTKFNGELMARNLCNKHYIFRIPILFGERKNQGSIFIEKMYDLYKNGKKELKIADDVINRPSYNKDIAKKIVNLITCKSEFGIYHIHNSGEKASLYDFAVEFFKQKGIKDIKIDRAKAADFAKNEVGKKPLNTTIRSNKIEPLRDWKEAMVEYQIKNEKNEQI